MKFLQALFASPIVSIKIGPDKTLFNVHEAALRRCSTYFRTALDSEFEEGKTRSFELDDEEPEIFQIFVAWLYSDELVAEDEGTAARRPVNQQEALLLWILGDRRGIPQLQNDAIKAWHKDLVKIKILKQLDPLVFDNTTDGSNLRRLFVDATAHLTTFENFTIEDHEKKPYPVEFLLALLYRFKTIDWDRRRWNWTERVDLSSYFEPIPEEPVPEEPEPSENKSAT